MEKREGEVYELLRVHKVRANELSVFQKKKGRALLLFPAQDSKTPSDPFLLSGPAP